LNSCTRHLTSFRTTSKMLRACWNQRKGKGRRKTVVSKRWLLNFLCRTPCRMRRRTDRLVLRKKRLQRGTRRRSFLTKKYKSCRDRWTAGERSWHKKMKLENNWGERVGCCRGNSTSRVRLLLPKMQRSKSFRSS
jgi:hypothetical protein